MARVGFERVCKRFGETLAVADFTLTVQDGELITVLGPSGCGKSTVLRLTAGLEPVSEGVIHLGVERLDALPPWRRNVAMVFQSYALYPHMTVRRNIEFPLRMRGVGRAERQRQATAIAELLEIGELLDRRPAQLSGGQRQRVALARALVRRPALFLLDEPLSNLDARLRDSVRQFIREVQRRVQVTTLYVTHDQVEAMTLGDRIVVMHQGRIQQVDAPAAVYERPANTFVAGFVGAPPMNLLPARYGEGVLQVADQRVRLPPSLRERLPSDGCDLTVGVRPEAFVAAGAEGDGVLAAVDPATREVLGSETRVRASLEGHAVTVRLFGVAREVPERVVAPINAFHLFHADGQRLGP